MKKKFLILSIFFLTITTTVKANLDNVKSNEFDMSKLTSYERQLWDNTFNNGTKVTSSDLDLSKNESEIVFLGKSKSDINISKSDFYSAFLEYDVLEVMKNIGAILVNKSNNDTERKNNYFAKVENIKEHMDLSSELEITEEEGINKSSSQNRKVTEGFIPNDPSFMSQFELIDSKANLVWEYGRGEGVKIGIADSGFSNLYSDKMTDIDRNRLLEVKYIGEGNNACYASRNQHGTKTSSIVGAAKTNNGEGMASMAHESIIQPYVFSYNCDTPESGYNTVDLVRLFDQAVEDQIDFLNMSWLTSGKSIAVELAILRALSSDVVTVVSRGNNAANNTVYPVCYEGVIGVLNINRNLTLSDSSSYGDCGSSSLSMIGTYGSNVHVLTINGILKTTGTSLSAPFLTSSLAVLKSIYPQMRNQDIVNATFKTAVDLGEKGYDQKFGQGALDIYSTIDYFNNGNHSYINYIDITSGEEIKIAKEVEFQLEYKTYPKNLTQSSLEWTSNNESVATVDSRGKVSAKQEGEAVVTVKAYGGASRSIRVIVGKPDLDGITISDKELEIVINASHRFSALASPNEAEIGELLWSSSDPLIASIDSTGKLTAIKEGTVSIKVETIDGLFSDLASVSVVKPPLEEINLVQKTVNLQIGQDFKYLVAGTPNEADLGKLIWSSSDSSIVSVDQDGQITAIKSGKVTIKVETENGLISDTSIVTVVKPPLEEINLVQKSVNLQIGQDFKYLVAGSPSEADLGKLVWSSSDSSIVSVDQNGHITALKSGIVNIKVETENGLISDTSTVTVMKPILEGISFVTPNVSFKIGSEYIFEINVFPNEAELGQLIWSSTDPSIASIDQNGKLIAYKFGEVTIKVETEDGLISDSASVSVTKPNLEKISLSDKNLTLKPNSKHKFKVSGSPSDAELGNLIWSSSDPTMVSVDQIGQVTAHKPGKVTIKVETENGLISDSSTVSVTSLTVDKISLSEKNVTLNVSSEHTFKVTGTPSDIDLGKLIWTSSDSTIVSVDQNGQVTAHKLGKVTIKVETEDGLISDSASVSVTKPNLEKISLSDKNLTLKPNSKHKFKVSGSPSDAELGDLIWSSSDPTMVSVDQIGQVTAHKPGKVTIKVETENGSISATSTVTVTSLTVDKISLSEKHVTLNINSEHTFKVTGTPSDIDLGKMIWSTSDSTIVSVNQKGQVSAHKPGKVIIKVETEDGSISATSTVTVTSSGAEKISISEKYLTLNINSKHTLKISGSLNETGVGKLIWTSSDPTIASVDQNGQVTAHKQGNVTIKVETENGLYSDKSTVRVIKASLPLISIFDRDVSINVGDSYQLKFNVDSQIESVGVLIWESSDPLIATVDHNGIVNAMKPGKVAIKLSTADRSISDEIIVNIKEDYKTVEDKSTSSYNLPHTGIENKTKIGIRVMVLGLGLLVINTRNRKFRKNNRVN